MNETKTIKARRADGTIEECSIQIIQSPHWKLIFSGAGLQEKEFLDCDLFESFISLRKELEGVGIQLLCAGARSDVFPSGMSRDMGGGRKAYITKLGCSPTRADLVDIFAYSDHPSVGTVSEQQIFHTKWISSRK
ncbi:MAG TPA: hypothetical protein VLK33_10585 [Terriglobales bacterium]|nr:hypothetical protein [Terriglobales bacterium]